MSNMKPGVVSTIRVNPKDCMGVLDVLDVAGIPTRGMSFASITSLALSSLLQTMREQQVIPTRDGFEYLDMMGPYLNGKNNSKKLAVTDTLVKAGSRAQVRGISRPRNEAPEPMPPAVEVEISNDTKQARDRLTELCQLKDMAEDGAGDWTAANQEEYEKLLKVVYG
jgi:hypothetical protein